MKVYTVYYAREDESYICGDRYIPLDVRAIADSAYKANLFANQIAKAEGNHHLDYYIVESTLNELIEDTEIDLYRS